MQPINYRCLVLLAISAAITLGIGACKPNLASPVAFAPGHDNGGSNGNGDGQDNQSNSGAQPSRSCRNHEIGIRPPFNSTIDYQPEYGSASEYAKDYFDSTGRKAIPSDIFCPVELPPNAKFGLKFIAHDPTRPAITRPLSPTTPNTPPPVVGGGWLHVPCKASCELIPDYLKTVRDSIKYSGTGSSNQGVLPLVQTDPPPPGFNDNYCDLLWSNISAAGKDGPVRNAVMAELTKLERTVTLYAPSSVSLSHDEACAQPVPMKEAQDLCRKELSPEVCERHDGVSGVIQTDHSDDTVATDPPVAPPPQNSMDVDDCPFLVGATSRDQATIRISGWTSGPNDDWADWNGKHYSMVGRYRYDRNNAQSDWTCGWSFELFRPGVSFLSARLLASTNKGFVPGATPGIYFIVSLDYNDTMETHVFGLAQGSVPIRPYLPVVLPWISGPRPLSAITVDWVTPGQ